MPTHSAGIVDVGGIGRGMGQGPKLACLYGSTLPPPTLSKVSSSSTPFILRRGFYGPEGLWMGGTEGGVASEEVKKEEEKARAKMKEIVPSRKES